MKSENNFAIAYHEERSVINSILETILFTGLFLMLILMLRPTDPYAFFGPFPWLCLAPVFCGLFFGALYGGFSLVIIFGYLFIYQSVVPIDNFIMRESIAGTICITFIAGVFSSYWQSRIRHDSNINQYVRQHLEDLSREYYLLRISHDRIENAFISKPMTYRDAFKKIEDVMKNGGFKVDEQTAGQFLNIFCQYCSIDAAAFCWFDESTHENHILASVGSDFVIDINDPLIKNMIDEKVPTYLAVNTLTYLHNSLYLAVIPMVSDKDNNILGFVVIKNMPFWSLTHDNMEVLGVFAAVFVLFWSSLEKIRPLLKAFPMASAKFLHEYQALLSLKNNHKVESFLTGIIIPDSPIQETIVYTLQQQNRSLDSTWVLPLGSNQLVIKILSLTSIQGMMGYNKRLDDYLKSNFDLRLNSNGIFFRSVPIGGNSAIQQLHDFIEGFNDVAE